MPSAAAQRTKNDTEATELGQKLAGKYLTFKLAGEEYGIDIRKVKEIIPMQKATRIPRAPDYVRGVINLRGKVIPVVDLRVKFGMERAEDTERTCVIVAFVETTTRSITMGLVIDEVKDVLNIAAGDIQEAPSFEAGIDTQFILGIGKAGQTVTILLDANRVLAVSEVEQLDSAAGTTEKRASPT
jgi:purine-binding chemotaxis protein CheW